MAGTRGGTSGHRVCVGAFPSLEPELFRAIAAWQRDDPLRPVAVVVASNLLGVHLRRRYVEWREGEGLVAAHGGIAWSTLEAFAAASAGPGEPPLPPFGGFALVSAALARLPEARVFGDLAGRADLVPSIEATLRDLADAGISPRAFRAFVEGPSLAAERRLLLGAIARLYETAERDASAHETPGKLLRRAAASVPPSDEAVAVYGFYDATGIQRDFLAALARRRPLLAFVPRAEGASGDFADPFAAWLARTLGVALEALEFPRAPIAGFHRRLGGAAADPPPPDAVRLVSAASAADERTEIAREILLAVEDGIPLHAIGVIVRESSAWSGALSRELGRLGIPSFERSAESAAGSVLGRAVRLWWELEERDFSRTDVLGVLDLLEKAGGREVSAAARVSARRAGIVGGAEAWSERLRRLAAETGHPAERAAILAFADECGRVVGSAQGWPRAPLSWGRWADEISHRLVRLFAADAVPPPLVSAAEALRALEALGGEVERDSAAHVFFGALDEQREASGRLGVDGVFIGTAMAARGLSFSATIVAQLVEREFPIPGRPDPLLFDGERRELGERSGRPVPLKVLPRAAEERQLFGLAVESALRRLVLTTSRRDEAMARDRLPSPFFADARIAAGGDDRVRTTETGVPTDFGPAVSETEALERALARSGPATVAAADPRLGRDLERRELARAPRFTVFDGRLGPAARPALETYRPSAVASISASRVGVFGACAYRYFLRSIQGLRPWEEPDRAAELDPLGLGITFHDAARRIAESARSWPPAPDEEGRIAGPAVEAALARYESERGAIVPELIRALARDRIALLVGAWLDHERRRGDALRPRAAEASVGTAEAPFVVDAGPFSVRFVGAIDRIDEDAAHRAARVVDYKVKLAAGFAKAFGDDGRIVGGEAVQLPVYALAAGGRVASEYLVIEAGGAAPGVETIAFGEDRTAESIDGFRAFLRGMEEAVAAGAFVPRTTTRLRKDPCRLCDFADVCGPGHVERFLAKEDDPDAAVRAVRALSELP